MSVEIDQHPIIIVDHPSGPIIVRRRFPWEPLCDAYRLIFEVYVNELGIVDAATLSSQQVDQRIKFDAWDTSPDTTHILAFQNGAIVGHMRILRDGLLGLPIEANGFSLTEDRSAGMPICEVSKLIVAKACRGGDLAQAFYWYTWQICHIEWGLPGYYFTCEPNLTALYAKHGGETIGEFLSKEFGKKYIAMRIRFLASFADHVRKEPSQTLVRPASANPMAEEQIRAQITSVFGAQASERMSVKRLGAGGGANTGGVWRVSVPAVTRSCFSCVGKEVVPGQTDEDPSKPLRWDHEISIYSTPLSLAQDLIRPNVYSVRRLPERAFIFLEDLQSKDAGPLRIGEAEELALHLGRWHGAIAADGTKPPTRPWLDWYVSSAASSLDSLPEIARKVPALGSVCEVGEWASLQHIWSQRETLLRSLHLVPWTFAHQDTNARNVFVKRDPRQRGQFALIDWALAAPAPVGSELGPLLYGSSLLFAWSVGETLAKIEATIDAYVSGLGYAGMPVSRDTVRRTFDVSAALRYVAWSGHRLQAALSGAGRKWAEDTAGHPLEDIVERYVSLRKVIVDRAMAAC